MDRHRELAEGVERIEKEGVRCVFGMRFYFKPDGDVRPEIVALRRVLDEIPRPEPLSRIEYRHRDHFSNEPLTIKKAAQLDRWLRGRWPNEVLTVHLSSDASVSNNVFGFDVRKPATARGELQVAYSGWPAVGALDNLDELERVFFRILSDRPVVLAHCGPMLVESPEWPEGVSLGDLIRHTTELCAKDPEWDPLIEMLGSVYGLTSVSWWTYLGAGISDGLEVPPTAHVVKVRGGCALRSSPSPFGRAAAVGQAAIFSALEDLIIPAALAGSNLEIQRVARHERGRGRLREAISLYEANSSAGQEACAANDAATWDACLQRYIELARDLRALGLPDHDARGDPSRSNPSECRGLLPTILHRAPPAVAGERLAALYEQAWGELAGEQRDRHGKLLRASLLAEVVSLGEASRRQRWRDAEIYRKIQLAGALPALFALGGIDLVRPYLKRAEELAREHPVLHHALARIFAATGRPELVSAQVEAAVRAGYEHADRLVEDEYLGLSPPPEDPPTPTEFEPAKAIFAGPNLVVVETPTRKRFTFHCRNSGLRAGDPVRITGFDGSKARYLEFESSAGRRLHEEW
jgi:hypothetical protein